MDRGQEHAGRGVDRVRDQAARRDLDRERRLDRRRIDLEQRRRARDQLLPRQRAMALAERLLEHVAEARAQAERRVRSNAEAFGQLIGGLEPDAADVAGEAIRIFADRLDRALAVGFEDARGAQRAQPVRMQEQHDVAYRPLFAPGGRDPPGEAPPDPRHFAQALRLALDHLEHLVAERRDQLFGHRAADAFDHARAEIRLDALERVRRHRDHGPGAELQAIARAGLPLAVGAHDLAGRHPRALADHGHRLALLGELDPQHAKAALGIVERDPLDQAGQGARLRLGRGERERSGVRRRAVLTAGLHGART
jgi:hypothetical protein